NLAGSFFNFSYNTQLIVKQLTDAQRDAFWDVAAPVYNIIAYPLFFVLLFYLLWPMMRCLKCMRQGEAIDAEHLQFCRRRLVNFPVIQLILNPVAWAPGIVFFPWVICGVGGSDNAGWIWSQFAVSFVVSTIFTTVQTFFIIQSFLTAYLYPEFFKDARPETVPGIIAIPFTVRLVMLWSAVALMPMVALLAVALNFAADGDNPVLLYWFGPSLLVVSAVSGGGIFWLVGRDLWRWIQLQTEATGQIAEGNFDVRIDHPRPDEWGKLTNRFNDMAAALAQAWESHETLGQLVSPEVRDRILSRMTGFEVVTQEITVLFVDIRGFTSRCSGADPERIGKLLNRFLTLALQSIEEKGGYVNKFLGDGVMALFGATHPQDNHADLAIASALELLRRLCELNQELVAQGEAPLIVGIGIHTGPALVGCFGATVQGDAGQPLMRREFTAIGETVNLCQRIEQLTKKCGGPILVSAGTHACLRETWSMERVGPQDLPGSPQPMVVYKVGGG
ncbi:MAG: adenylate/guanylate cyclase domain-containing protein, partial [Planctomycetes bacterium]|nr:adenylate/guanylate cyclase domain-containing protein [Planctomycetota bacterium]